MKVHQHKAHMNQKGLGITILNPTPEMEQSLIKTGFVSATRGSDYYFDEKNQVQQRNRKPPTKKSRW